MRSEIEALRDECKRSSEIDVETDYFKGKASAEGWVANRLTAILEADMEPLAEKLAEAVDESLVYKEWDGYIFSYQVAKSAILKVLKGKE